MTSWRSKIQLYLDKRLFYIFALGISSGLPYMMIGSAVSAWLKDEGIGRSTIGYIGAVFAAYSINFLWSPIVDRVKIPLFANLLGQRKSWIFITQLIVVACCFTMSTFSSATSLQNIGLIALVLAISASTQDIAIDGFRIDTFSEKESDKMSAAAAMATSGWWTGWAGIGAIPFFLVDLPGWSWPRVYFIMCLFMIGLACLTLIMREPKTQREALQNKAFIHHVAHLTVNPSGSRRILTLFGLLLFAIIGQISGYFGYIDDIDYASFVNLLFIVGLIVAIARTFIGLHKQSQTQELAESSVNSRLNKATAWIMVSAIDPVAEFFQRNGRQFALSVLLFIFLFKIGEAFLGRMSVVFYKEIGFSNEDIALYSKLVTWWLTIVFSFLGSALTIRFGIFKGLMVAGIAMASSNLMFSWLAMVGPDKNVLLAAVVVDGFTQAWSSVAFVSFLSLMCNRAFSASQYALLASLGTLGRTLLASSSGALVDWLNGNWALFFIITTVMVIPSLIFLYRLRHQLAHLDQRQ